MIKIIISALMLLGCNKTTKVLYFKTGAQRGTADITSFSPVAAQPGEWVTFKGHNLRYSTYLLIDSRQFPLINISDDGTSGQIVMPKTSRPGAFNFEVRDKTRTNQISKPELILVADTANDKLPIYMATPTEICLGIRFRDAMGDVQDGARDCTHGMKLCSSDAEQGCVSNSQFKAADTNTIRAIDLRAGLTIGGITGTGSIAPADCSANAVIGCATTTAFKSADLTNLSAGNIKSGTTIAGVTGNYPSSTSPIATASATDDLVSSAFQTQIRTATNFEWWDSSGTRFQATGDANLTANNIVSGTTIHGVTGVAIAGIAPDPWDVRGGTTINGVTGKIRTNCRNTGNKKLGGSVAPNPFASVSALAVSPGVFQSASAHGLVNGDIIQISGSTIPTGASSSLYYFVVNATATDFSASRTPGGTGIDLTSSGANVKITKIEAEAPIAITSAGTNLFNVNNSYAAGDRILFSATTGPDYSSGSPGQVAYYYPGTVWWAYAPTATTLRLSSTLSSGGNPIVSGTGSNMWVTRLTGTDGMDIWDTIDDYNGGLTGLPPTIVDTPTPWDLMTQCGGIDSTSTGDEDNVWKDVTTDVSSNPIACAALSANCSYRDKNTKLDWSKQSPSSYTWPMAIEYCQNLNHNNHSDWRLPTEKELHDAAIHGIRSTQSTNFISSFSSYFSATSVSSSYFGAIYVDVSSGYASSVGKSSTAYVLCVRP